jgi:hypothetical protein
MSSKKPQQTATELSRTLAGQWSKSEKRLVAALDILACNRRAHAAVKAFKQNQILNK